MAKKKVKKRISSSSVRKEAKGSSSKVLLSIAVIFILVVIAAIAFGIAFLATDGFDGRVNTLTVEIAETNYTTDAKEITLYPDTKIKVKSVIGNPYTVKIEAIDDNDFEFSVGGESGYRWKHLAGKDLTGYFEIVKDIDGFTINHTGINGILKKYYGNDVSVVQIEPMDFLRVTITCGSQERQFCFYPAIQRIEGITLEPDNIIFGGEKT